MSPKRIALNPDIRRLDGDGFFLEIKNNHLAVHDIPFVTPERTVEYGSIITDIAFVGENITKPANHQVWFQGRTFPCHSNGQPIAGLAAGTGQSITTIWQGFNAQYRFSTKINNQDYPDYYSKIIAYVNSIANEALALNGQDPRQGKGIKFEDEESVFCYPDTASTRAHILAATQKLEKGPIAIIGLGGTGSYVLDLIAKTPPPEIHLFDGDVFENHTAFRAPGAPSVELVSQNLPKVTYYSQIYSAMRRGIVPHNAYITADNLSQLDAFAFVFLCVDSGSARKLISSYLIDKGIPFVDSGMELMMLTETTEILGVCRVTLSSQAKSDHFNRLAPIDIEDANVDDVYRTNIQVADLNALCAILAVGKWKRLWGFYQDSFHAHHTTYTVNTEALTRDEFPAIAEQAKTV